MDQEPLCSRTDPATELTNPYFFYRSFAAEKGVVKIIYSIVCTLLMSLVVIYMFCISLIPHTVVDGKVRSELPVALHHLHADYRDLHIVNSYGLFRRFVSVKID